jgi:enoyl-CoA hydratase
MLSADYVIIAANEVALGLKMPRVAAAMLRHRLNPAAYQRAVTLSEYFDVESTRHAGFFDEVVDPAELIHRAESCADEFAKLDRQAHTASKRRIRAALIRKIRWSIPLDLLDAAIAGLRRSRSR